MSARHTTPDEAEFRLMPHIRAVLASETVEQCHAALSEAVGAPDGDRLPLVCEIALSPRGRPEIVWQAGDPRFHEQQESGPSPIADWFGRVRHHPGRPHPFDSVTSGMIATGRDGTTPYIGILAANDALSELLEASLRDFSAIAAQHIGRLRLEEESRRRQSRLDKRDDGFAELLQAGSDLLWETQDDGAIRVTHVFNNRTDLAHRFRGRSFDDLVLAGGKSLAEAVAQGRPLRQIRVEFRDTAAASGLTPFYMTICPRSPSSSGRPRYHGAVSTGPDLARDRLAVDVRVLENMMGARAREEELRRETEAMLQGLRVLLLASLSFREKLEQLGQLLAGAIKCGDVRLLQLRPGDVPRLLLPSADFAPESARAVQRIVTQGEDRPVRVVSAASEDGMLLCRALDSRAGDLALVALPFQAERLYLLCSARGDAGFSAQDLAFTERFSLLLQQALLLRDDQERMAHTAKLSALGQMSTSIAHELRQPLNTISIAAQNIDGMIERDAVDPPLLKEKVDRIMRQIDRAGKVMDRMRRFGRKSAGDYKPIPLDEIVRSARAMMDHVTERTGILVEEAIGAGVIVLADELEIEQVLVNLIQNASDAIAGHRPSDASSPGRIRIWSEADTADPCVVRAYVDDNGPGFPPEVLAHALDAFFTTKPKTEGTGLGLSISHAILREHGGRLEIGNCADGGRITLHLRRPEPPSAKVLPIARHPRS